MVEVLVPLVAEVAEVVSADSYIFNKKEYPIEIIRKDNKNTYLRVKDNKIIITTNYLVTNKRLSKLIHDNTAFIDRMLERSQKKENDNEFRLFGKTYNIIYGFTETEIEENKIYCKDIKALNKYLIAYITDIYAKRLAYWYKLFEEDIPTPNLKIRKMTSRWGVCNLKNKNITLNLELSKYEMEALDYVIVHELSHFIYPDHSKKFWSLVAKYYPEYKDIRKRLRNSV